MKIAKKKCFEVGGGKHSKIIILITTLRERNNFIYFWGFLNSRNAICMKYRTVALLLLLYENKMNSFKRLITMNKHGKMLVVNQLARWKCNALTRKYFDANSISHPHFPQPPSNQQATRSTNLNGTPFQIRCTRI